MAKRRAKHGYCWSCGDRLRRPCDERADWTSVFCTLRCGAGAFWSVTQSGNQDNVHCQYCGEPIEGHRVDSAETGCPEGGE